MDNLLSAAEIVDLVRSSGTAQPSTIVTVYRAAGSAVNSGNFKNIGPTYIDFGDTTYTQRWPLNNLFIRMNCYFNPNKIDLILATTAPA